MLLCCIADLVDFSDEEGYGKYLDLHALHREFINIKGMEVSVRVCVERDDFL